MSADADTSPAEDSGATPISGPQAAAILLLLMEEGDAALLLRRLEPDELRMLGSAMYGVVDVAPPAVEQVLDDFVDRARTKSMLGHGAHRHLSAAMHQALGSERASVLLGRVAPAEASEALSALRWMEAEDIAALVGDEHPQIAALVLAHVAPETAADVLGRLAEPAQEDIMFRMATLGPVSADALAELEALLAAHAHRSGGTSAAATKRGGTSEVAAIMNNLAKPANGRILQAMAKKDKLLAQAIEEDMFVFDDLAALDDKALGAVMRAADSSLLVPALKGAEAKLRSRMLGAMSKRAAQSIADEMAEAPPMKRADVLAAQRGIIAIAKKLADEGTINLGGKGDDLV